MSYIKYNGAGGSNYTLPPASANALGGVKIGSGLNVDANGTISVAGGGTNGAAVPQVVDTYIASGRVRGMGLAQENGRTGMTLIVSPGTILEIVLLNGVVKRFSIPEGMLTIPSNSTLRMDISTGSLRIINSTTSFINEICLIRTVVDTGSMVDQGNGALLVTGGVLQKYMYPFGSEVETIIAPKVTRTSFTAGYGESMCFIAGDLWRFDKTSDTSSITICDPVTFAKKQTLSQAGYHFNTTDYNPAIDALCTIYGYGDVIGNNKNTSIRILHNVSTWKSKTGVVIDAADTTSYDQIDLIGMGEGPQPVWGDDNNGQNNIIYVQTDASVRVRKLLLGKGDTNLGSGNFVAGKPDNRFNGSFKVIGDWTQIHGSGRNQDAFFHNGCFYQGKDSGGDSFGQQGAMMHKLELLSNGIIKRNKIFMPTYDVNGNLSDAFSYGCTIKDGIVYYLIGTIMHTFPVI